MEHTKTTNWIKYIEYLNFIDICRYKKYNEVTHKHHIIPKSFGGKNNKHNLVKLSVSDHIQAHFLFAQCFDFNSIEYNKNIWSIRILNKYYKNNKIENIINKSYKGKNNPFYGKKHTEETKQKIAEKISQLLKGVKYDERYDNPDLEKQKRSKGVKLYHESLSQTEKQKRINNIKKSLHNNKNLKCGYFNNSTYSLIVNNNLFLCLQDALKYYNITKGKLYRNFNVKKLKNNKNMENNENLNIEKILERNDKFIIKFYTDTCMPCKQIDKILNEVNTVDIIKINAHIYPELVNKYNIKSVPTLLFFNNNEIKYKHVGLLNNIEQINTIINNL